ncbi:serine/threonine-protein kinase Sgk2 [Daldinia caldariorum]|uniref:serine/threonine-protein kinase Sgk2 n=1 Tax=Daldinia caldariorum TaxID=326644 RepID=UPI00200721D2|nr:serine/threonine-protein kinase Sgk2 [Daldinia caldariorum]KAI1471016.1 serine/threonine-protein kinase Sgk2 [Daldinia caldariorum]
MTARPPLSDIIQTHPIGKGLDAFRELFQSICEDRGISYAIDALDQLSQQDFRALSASLLYSLASLLASSRLFPRTGRGTVQDDILRPISALISAVNSEDFDLNCIKPLLKVYKVVTESTPPQPIASSFLQTPWLHNTGSFANSSEYRQDVDRILKLELGPLYVGLPQFRETYFGRVAGLKAASEAVFQRCREGDNPIFDGRWRGWPEDANQDGVLVWFADVIDRLATFAEAIKPSPARRRPLAQPNKPIQGSTAERKLDVGFVSNPNAIQDSLCHWSQILIPGELKSNLSADTASKAWLDLRRYAREVLAAQDTRRFVLGFTLCGSIMRVWEFDRLGGIASERFDIHEDPLQFVATILGFLWMTEEDLGFGPAIRFIDGQRCIEIKRISCVAGRATTCWKAHRKEDPRTPLVIKDSWQYVERDEEGELLQDVTNKQVVNVARYYHHETVYARNYRPRHSVPFPTTIAVTDLQKGRSSSAAGTKRSSSQTGAPLPASKRSCSASPTKAGSNLPPNRIHRRVIVSDYGKPIYEASSLEVLLDAWGRCIQGHKSLLQLAGLLHQDISINNLMINEDPENPSWSAFLIDLDLAVYKQREDASGAQGMTGTRAFMAIGALLGEQHSFMHDLESFFWVLFWICIHYEGPGKGRPVSEFDKWNFMDAEELATMKLGTISEQDVFSNKSSKHFTTFYQPLIPWVNLLRQAIFPNGGRWKKEDEGLYTRIEEICRAARADLKGITTGR